MVLPVVLACVMQATPAAAASADVMAVHGGGSLWPPMTALPAASAVTFDGTATVIGTDGVASTFSCAWNGTEIGNIATSEGAVSGLCGPIAFSNCVTVRVAVTWLMTCVRAGAQIGDWSLIGTWVPDQTPPSGITGYGVSAVGGYGQINSP